MTASPPSPLAYSRFLDSARRRSSVRWLTTTIMSASECLPALKASSSSLDLTIRLTKPLLGSTPRGISLTFNSLSELHPFPPTQ